MKEPVRSIFKQSKQMKRVLRVINCKKDWDSSKKCRRNEWRKTVWSVGHQFGNKGHLENQKRVNWRKTLVEMKKTLMGIRTWRSVTERLLQLRKPFSKPRETKYHTKTEYRKLGPQLCHRKKDSMLGRNSRLTDQRPRRYRSPEELTGEDRILKLKYLILTRSSSRWTWGHKSSTV